MGVPTGLGRRPVPDPGSTQPRKETPMTRSTRDRTARIRRHTYRPRLDALEDRTLLTGFLDPTFGVGGSVFTNLPGSQSNNGNAVVVQPDGKTVVVGSLVDNSGYA